MNSVLHNDKIIGAGVAPERPRAPLRYYINRLTRPRCGITVTASTTQRETNMTNLETVRAYVRGEYSYDDVTDPLTVVKIARIEMPTLPDWWAGIQAGDYEITDEVTRCVVRVEAGNVRVIWKNC